MRTAATLIVLGLLSACGADGAPEAPTDGPTIGVTISGTARVGVTKAL